MCLLEPSLWKVLNYYRYHMLVQTTSTYSIKIHKSLEKPTGRPIMAANQHLTERLLQYVDEDIKKHVHSILNYIKDTNHFIQICQDLNLPPNARLVMFDVGSPYTNIHHEKGIMALGEFMAQFTDYKTTTILKRKNKNCT